MQQHNPQQEPEQSPDLATVQALLGPEITTWNFSDDSLRAALELRTEQEKTRQEYYKLELRKKTSELLTDAMRYNIPASMIPLLFNASPDSLDQRVAEAPQQPSNPYVYPPPPQIHSQPPASFPSSSKNPPYDALGLNQDTERYPSPTHGHQRNLSMPQQPTIIPSEYQLRQPQPPPPQQKFRPTHAHHASMSAISPSRYTTPAQSSYQRQWQPAPYFPPPAAASSQANAESPGTSMHHLIQFHHWQPNQTKPPSSSPKKDNATVVVDDTQSPKRRRSMALDRSSPTPKSGDTSSTALASASAHSRRRSMHQRQRSETSMLQGESLSKMTLYGATGDGMAAAGTARASVQAEFAPPPPKPVLEEKKSELSPDFKYPAPNPPVEEKRDNELKDKMDTERDESDAPPRTAREHARGPSGDVTMVDAPDHEKQRRDKQGVNFLISDNARSPK